MRKKLIGGLAAAALFMGAPAWAHGGHGHWKHGKHWYKHPVRERVVVREYWRPVPVYPGVAYPVYPALAPGIHVVIPSIYIPFR